MVTKRRWLRVERALARSVVGAPLSSNACERAARRRLVRPVSPVARVRIGLLCRCEDYVHRVGRTGRAGATGHAVTLFTKNENQHARELQSILQVCELSEKPGLLVSASRSRRKHAALLQRYRAEARLGLSSRRRRPPPSCATLVRVAWSYAASKPEAIARIREARGQGAAVDQAQDGRRQAVWPWHIGPTHAGCIESHV